MADGDPTLRVPTHTVRVAVAFPGGAAREAELFAPVGDVPRPARARVAELLERDQLFLPARDASTGEVQALGARAIVWISGPLARSGELLGDDELFEHRRDVRIELVDGSLLEGELLYSAPAPRARVVDVLNAVGRFVPLWLADRVIFVNKSFVRRLAEVPHVHRPSVLAPPPVADQGAGADQAAGAGKAAKATKATKKGKGRR